MTTRRQWHLYALSAVVSAALLAACGGGGSDQELNVGKIVSFGDSISDLGTYTPATQIPLGQAPGVPPFFGGRFTTNTYTGYTAASNTSTATIWVEWVASRVGVPITVAEVGFAGQSRKCPAAANPALVDSCTGYGQGGSLVTNPNGIGHAGGAGALTVPVVTQVANHLEKFGSFDSNDIVFMLAGGNEILVAITAVSQGLPAPTALANVQTAGTELAAIVKDQIVAKGARRVAVFTAPDISPFPAFNQSPALKELIAQLTSTFNTALTTGLEGVNVRYIDTQAVFSGFVANPAQYGLTNVTEAACDPAKIEAVTGGRIKDGSAMFCNASPASAFTAAGVPNLNTIKAKAGASGASTWLFADSVHPSSGGHKAIGDVVITNIKNFGWIPPNL